MVSSVQIRICINSSTAADILRPYSESTSIPKNPRTDRPVGYAFVDLSSPGEAERAIAELSGREILERKVSVQLARKPEPAGEKGEATSGGDASGGEGRRRQSGRGRGRGRGKGGRGGRAARGVSAQISFLVAPANFVQSKGEEGAELPATSTTTGEVLPLTETTNKEGTEKTDKDNKGARPPRERRERGPPADGIPSKNKVMVANLPYDLSEEKVKHPVLDLNVLY